jgi:predicted TIM-barrel fold metal-dependent hydrolase
VIIDSHCHAWRAWPYDKSVPDPDHRGSIEALLYEMDTHGVEHATVVCARIGNSAGGEGFGNEDNNDYVSAFARKHPDRITAWVDIDCIWRKEHHTPGAIKRMIQELDRNEAHGFTHYVGEEDGWFTSDEGREFFQVAAERKVIASMAIGPAWLPALQQVAQDNPTLPILIHHMSFPGNNQGTYSTSDIAALVKCAEQPNIGVKISGFNYNSFEKWNFPYADSQRLFKTIVEAFGAHRLYWGSDFPASRDMLTYTQAIEVLRSSVDSITTAEKNLILGENLHELLKTRVINIK